MEFLFSLSTGTMKKFGHFLFKKNGSADYKELIDLRTHWKGSSFPVATTECGFLGDKCLVKPSEDTKGTNII